VDEELIRQQQAAYGAAVTDVPATVTTPLQPNPSGEVRVYREFYNLFYQCSLFVFFQAKPKKIKKVRSASPLARLPVLTPLVAEETKRWSTSR